MSHSHSRRDPERVTGRPSEPNPSSCPRGASASLGPGQSLTRECTRLAKLGHRRGRAAPTRTAEPRRLSQDASEASILRDFEAVGDRRYHPEQRRDRPLVGKPPAQVSRTAEVIPAKTMTRWHAFDELQPGPPAGTSVRLIEPSRAQLSGASLAVRGAADPVPDLVPDCDTPTSRTSNPTPLARHSGCDGAPQLRVVSIAGAQIHAITEAECVRFVTQELDAGRGGSIETMNVDHLLRFVTTPSFASFCRSATLVVADGMPLVWASRVQGTPLPERVTGADLLWSLCEAAATRGRSVFLLGGEPGVADKTAARLVHRFPSLRIAGTMCPEVRPDRQCSSLSDIGRALSALRPDIVFVALGMPKQEQLIATLGTALPASWWVGVGAAFSLAAGVRRRAPEFLRRGGFEWLFRLCQEPRRLAGRYLARDLPFAVALLLRIAWHRMAGNPPRRPQPPAR